MFIRIHILKIQLFSTCILFSLSAMLFSSVSYHITDALTQLENQIFCHVVHNELKTLMETAVMIMSETELGTIRKNLV